MTKKMKFYDPIFTLAVETSYPVNEIRNFMTLADIKMKETETLLKRFSECGVNNLKDVNTLFKMGYSPVGRPLKVDFAIGEEVTFSYRLSGEIKEIKEDDRFVISRDGVEYIVRRNRISKL